MSLTEPLLVNTSNKYTIFPIKNKEVWNCFINHKKAIWFVDDVDPSLDLNDWKKLNDDEKYFIKHILAFFAASDGIVMENLCLNFSNEIQMAEARSFYAMQTFIENEHSIMYSKLIETYVTNINEKTKLFNAIETIPSIAKKAQWAQKWINNNARFALRLFAFAIVEGLFFSGAFCSIYWIAERGIMPGLTMSNSYISRDENLHTEFAVMLYNKYVVNKLTNQEATDIFIESVELEKEFIIEALPCSLLGMNVTLMSQYIEFVADKLCKSLGHESPFNGVKCPFPFMDKICMQSQTNFFDTRVSEYQMNVSSNEKTENLENLDFSKLSIDF
jgi:ribonucleoside-diphosphate reductase beta chain